MHSSAGGLRVGRLCRRTTEASPGTLCVLSRLVLPTRWSCRWEAQDTQDPILEATLESQKQIGLCMSSQDESGRVESRLSAKPQLSSSTWVCLLLSLASTAAFELTSMRFEVACLCWQSLQQQGLELQKLMRLYGMV